MIECPKCGYRNADGSEFCQNPNTCGTFLGYEGKKLEPLPGGVALSISPSTLAVEPGSQASSEIRVRNRGNIVDQFTLSVAGKPAGWAIVEPATLSLFPDAEGTAKVRFQPPKMWDSTAGRVQFSIRAQSKAAPGVFASQDGMLEIAPFASATAKLVPRTSRGSASADHRLVIENAGNAPLRATVEGSDPDELLAISVDRPMLVVQPGKSEVVQVQVAPRTRLTEGAAQLRPFQIQVQPDVGAPLVAEGSMLQEPVAPPAPPPKRRFPVALLIIPALLIAGVGAAFLLPPLMSGTLLASTGGSPAAAAVSSGNSAATPTPAAASTPTPTPTPTPSPTPVATPAVLCNGPATLQGTYIFDFESCKQASVGDVWWEQRTSTDRQLAPRNGAQIANLGPVNFNSVTLAMLKTEPYQATPINGSTIGGQLSSGTVIAIRTRGGHYAKMRIDSYGYNLLITSTTYQ